MSTQNQDVPISGPQNPDPSHPWERDMDRPVSIPLYIGRKLMNTIKEPVFWIRDNVILPNKGPKYYWYHRKYPRALPVDECYVDDLACIMEADIEFKRNRLVDRETLKLLHSRLEACNFYQQTKSGLSNYGSLKCENLRETFEREEVNFFTKYGDMKFQAGALAAYNKQKHRMIVERRRALKAEQEDAEIAAAYADKSLD